MKFAPIVLGTVVTSAAAAAQFANYRSEYVPDAPTAVAIGRAVSIPIYGKKLVQTEEPFTATRKGDTWIVFGTLHCPPKYICAGGTIEVTLSVSDGRILSVLHTE
jgi:hypothetical protein